MARFSSLPLSVLELRSLRFRLLLFLVRMWRNPCFLYLIFPLPVTL